MDVKQAYELAKAGKAYIVDVREEEELRESGLADGALWMPTSEMDEENPAWKAFKQKIKDKPSFFYCKSGQRSGRVAMMLSQEGYQTENIGGFKDWKAANLPTTTLK